MSSSCQLHILILISTLIVQERDNVPIPTLLKLTFLIYILMTYINGLQYD